MLRWELSGELLLALFSLAVSAHPVWAWFDEGHQIVAIIAADNLTPATQSHVAQILGVAEDRGSVEKPMAAAPIRTDPEFGEYSSILAVTQFPSYH